jgi:hypothetical protein
MREARALKVMAAQALQMAARMAAPALQMVGVSQVSAMGGPLSFLPIG